jgi:transcriptional regulator with XRE-family HTH domain
MSRLYHLWYSGQAQIGFFFSNMTHTDVDTELLGDLIRRRRKADGLSLRDAADQMGVSAPTLQRVEAGQPPNSANLIRITQWLQLPVDKVLRKGTNPASQLATVAQIEVHLRADPNLSAEAAEAIADAVQKLYAAFSKQARPK